MQSSRCNALESVTHSIGWSLSSSSELEGSQALPHKPPRSKCAQLTAQWWPSLLFIAPWMNRAVTPSLGKISHRPDALVELTGRAATRPIALRHPRGLPYSTTTAWSSNGHCAPMVKRDDQTRHFSDQTRRCAHHPRAQRHDRTRSTQRPNATVPASSCSLESSHRDRTCPIAYDRTRRAFDQLFVTHYTNGCLIRRAGSARDRTRRWQTLAPRATHTRSTDWTRRSCRDHVWSSVWSHHWPLSPPFLCLWHSGK
jgi:hypothetical protein